MINTFRYLALGIFWAIFLESLTKDHPAGPWTWRERLTHIVLWPIFLSVFIFKLFKNDDNE